MKIVTDNPLSVKEKDMANTNYILSPYPRTDVIILRKNPTDTLIYVNITLFTPTCFNIQGAILRDYCYILWAGSAKYVSGCKYKIKKQRAVGYVAVGLFCAFEKICQMLYNTSAFLSFYNLNDVWENCECTGLWCCRKQSSSILES